MTLCNTCTRADVSCPIYPQVTEHCVAHRAREIMKTPHPHAELLHAIADGWLGAADEFECHGAEWNKDSWSPASLHLDGIICQPNHWQVRRKPRTVKIGKREVQAGITESPENGAPVWITLITTKHLYHDTYCDSANPWHTYCLSAGLVHLTKEAAVAMGEALAAVAKGEE